MSPPRIKICGLTRLDDAERSVELGAWALGMVFWDGSPRRATMAEAQRIAGALRRRALIAGVFVDAPLDEVVAAAEAARLSLVQLHGEEGPAFAQEVARRTGARVIKAIRVRSRADVQALRAFHTDYAMLDGGGGTNFDWSLARELRDQRLIVAGGLTAENVGDAIAATRPYAVDVASGTESRPGIKDPEKLEAFFGAVQATADSPAATP